MLRSNRNRVVSLEEEKRLRWEGFAEKGGFKSEMKESARRVTGKMSWSIVLKAAEKSSRQVHLLTFDLNTSDQCATYRVIAPNPRLFLLASLNYCIGPLLARPKRVAYVIGSLLIMAHLHLTS